MSSEYRKYLLFTRARIGFQGQGRHRSPFVDFLWASSGQRSGHCSCLRHSSQSDILNGVVPSFIHRSSPEIPRRVFVKPTFIRGGHTFKVSYGAEIWPSIISIMNHDARCVYRGARCYRLVAALPPDALSNRLLALLAKVLRDRERYVLA